MHNVSERSIKQLNNMISGQLIPGQVLLLPVTAGDPNSKQRLLDMNHITEAGSVQLLGSGRDTSGNRAGQKDVKNTNKQGYQLDNDNSEGQQQLGSFLQGFHNMGINKTETKEEDG